jgi:phosphoribosylaminoimidazolecarboxamide formyltransferase / IMP cyclohydrolase
MQTTNRARLFELLSRLSEAEAAAALATLQCSAPAAAGDADGGAYPSQLVIAGRKVQDLRYGENPHQVGAVYARSWPAGGLAGARQLRGPAMSYTNWLDADAAMRLVVDFERPAAAIVKHTNPCGFAVADGVARAYELAFACDRRAAYGGVVAVNRALDAQLARLLGEIFLNVLVVPAAADAPAKLRESLRLLVVEQPAAPGEIDVRSIDGGLLVQTQDRLAYVRERARVMTGLEPSEEQWDGLVTAWKLARHVKSNAIAIVRDDMAVGVGAGQMSRIEAAELAITRAGRRARGAVAASDGLIPFPDVVEALAGAGVTAVIQPGGSIGDDQVASAANQLGLAMVSASERHFRH